MVRGPILAQVESVLIQRLAERGVHLYYARRSWSPGQGLRLEKVILHRAAKGDAPLIEVSALTIGISVPELLRTRTLRSRWFTKDATVTLHDEEGSQTFAHVTTRIAVRPGEIYMSRLDFQHGPRTFDLSGKILLPQGAKEPPAPPSPLVVDLSTVREVFSVLNFKESDPPFAVRGSFSVDLREGEAVWKADLSGTGRNVEWHGVPLRLVTVQGQLSTVGMALTADLEFTNGSADVSVTRTSWNNAPSLVAGTLTDGANRTDEFSAAYESAARTLIVSSLRGEAHLLEFAGNFPALIPHLPAALQVRKFPNLVVTNFSYSFDKQSDAWSIESARIEGPGDITLALGGEPLRMVILEGVVAFTDNRWKARLKAGPLSWKRLSVKIADFDGTLAASRLNAQLNLRLTKGSTALEILSADWPRAPLHFTGSLTDSQGLIDQVTGFFQQEPAELRISKLSGKANLFEYASNFLGTTARPPQGFSFRAFPEIALTDFTYRPDKPVNLGSLRLVTPADLTIMFRGRPVALDRVQGQIGFDGLAWKLSDVRGRLFDGPFALDGSYENGMLRAANITASNLHLAELKDWLGESPNSIGAAVLAFDYRGNISSDLSQFTGAGHIRMENAPIVKVPLLDQTYALASAFTAPLSRRGSGRLDATFTSANGIAKVSQFTATSEAVRVTADGTLDLRKREVSGRARGSLRGLFGLATGPLSRTLEMQVSGPLDNIRVRPLGLKGILTVPKTVLPNTAKGAAEVVKDGVALPLRVFDLFKLERPTPKL